MPISFLTTENHGNNNGNTSWLIYWKVPMFAVIVYELLDIIVTNFGY